MSIGFESICCDLLRIGIRDGDTVFITADLQSVGYFVKNRDTTLASWMEILRRVVGHEGTVIVAGYTDSFNRFRKDKNVIFEKGCLPNSGALSMAFLHDENSIRSSHPTNSYFGFGKYAEIILASHDRRSTSYSVIGTIAELNGKNLMLGTLDKRNGPMAFHYAQECLGQTRGMAFGGVFQTYYKDGDGSIKLFTRNDVGGCSRGAYHLYGDFLVGGAVTFGKVGKAYSALLDMRKSVEIAKSVLIENPSLTRCADKRCIYCYGRWTTSRFGVINYYVNRVLNVLRRGD